MNFEMCIPLLTTKMSRWPSKLGSVKLYETTITISILFIFSITHVEILALKCMLQPLPNIQNIEVLQL